MIVDQSLIVCDNVDVSAGAEDWSSSIDLTLSPELGSGGQLVAVLAVTGTYAANSSTSTLVEIVTSSTSNLETTERVLGTLTILDEDLESADITGFDIGAVCAPFVIRVNPDHSITQRSGGTGTAERYIGLRFTHAGATPTTMFVTAYFTDNFQGDPHSNYGAVGMLVDRPL